MMTDVVSVLGRFHDFLAWMGSGVPVLVTGYGFLGETETVAWVLQGMTTVVVTMRMDSAVFPLTENVDVGL